MSLFVTSVSRCSVLPSIAGLAVDVVVFAVAEIPGGEGLGASLAVGALFVVGPALHFHALSMEYLK